MYNLIVLFDGLCGVCNKSVQLILKLDKKGLIRFSSLQSDFSKDFISKNEELQKIDSIIILEGEKYFYKSAAIFRIIKYLGFPYNLFLIFRILPKALLDYFYDLFAKNRFKIIKKLETCILYDKKTLERFID